MLRASSCPSCVWMQASPLNFTNVAACTEQLALSLYTAHRTSISMVGTESDRGSTQR